MPTKIETFGTTATKVLAANPKRVGVTFTNYTSMSPSAFAGRYIRISDNKMDLDTGEAYILLDGSSITLTKKDGDHTEKAFYARSYDDNSALAIWEQIE